MKKTNKIIAGFLGIIFCITTIAFSPENAAAGAAIPEPDFGEIITSIPREFGTVSALNLEHPQNPQSPFVIYIQDAHANPEGQENVANMLAFLYKDFPQMIVGVEGAVGKFHPEYINIFPDYPKANEAIKADLKSKGELNGAERFLLSEGTRRAKVFGVEEEGFYNESLKIYSEIKNVKTKWQKEILQIRQNIDKENSRVLNDELKSFLKEQYRRKDGRFGQAALKGNSNLTAYWNYLSQKANKNLGIDLANPIEQLRFPNFYKILNAKNEDVLKSVEVDALFAEMEKLERFILENLIQTEAEQKLVSKIRQIDLIEKALSLEMNRSEYQTLFEQKGEIENLLKGNNFLTALFADAINFYDLSLARDKSLLENLFQIQSNSAEGANVLILYGGGFHTDGVTQLLNESGINFAVLTPRITSFDDGENYERIMSTTEDRHSLRETFLLNALSGKAAEILKNEYRLSSEQIKEKAYEFLQNNTINTSTAMPPSMLASPQQSAQKVSRSETRGALVERKVSGELTRDFGFAGVVVKPRIRLAEEYFFEFDPLYALDAKDRFNNLLEQLRKDIRENWQGEQDSPQLIIIDALISIFDSRNYELDDWTDKFEKKRELLNFYFGREDLEQIHNLINAAIEAQIYGNNNVNPVSPFVRFLKNMIRQTLPQVNNGEQNVQWLNEQADSLLTRFRILLFSEFRSATEPEKQMELFEDAMEKYLAKMESDSNSSDFDISSLGTFFKAALKDAKKRYLGENRGGTLEKLKSGENIISIIYRDILMSKMATPEELENAKRVIKQQLMYGQGLYERRAWLDNLPADAPSKQLWNNIPDLISIWEAIIAEISQQGMVERDGEAAQSAVVIKIDQSIGVSQFKEILKLYPDIVGAITDSVTANSHIAAISEFPFVVVDAGNQDFKEIRDGDFVAVEPTADRRITLYVNASPEEQARIKENNEKQKMLQYSYSELVPLTSGFKFYSNMDPGENLDSFAGVSDGIGLTRTENDEELETAIVNMIRLRRSSGDDARPFSELSRPVLDIMVSHYHSQLSNSNFADKTHKFRTIDVQLDKNEKLFVYYNGGTGSEFYETEVGREVITAQLMAFFMIRAREFLEGKIPANDFRILFPQIRNQKDALLLRDEILPDAVSRAKKTLVSSKGQLAALGDADEKLSSSLSDEQIGNSVESALNSISFEITVETVSLFDRAEGSEGTELTEILKMQWRECALFSGVSVGMNDLECDITKHMVAETMEGNSPEDATEVERDVLRRAADQLKRNYETAASLSRESVMIKDLFGHLTPAFVKYYKQISKAAYEFGLTLSFCGETAGRDEFSLFAEFLKQEFKGVSIARSMKSNKIARAKFLSYLIERQLKTTKENPEWFSLYSANRDATSTAADYLANRFLNDKNLQSFLSDLAKFQYALEGEGFYSGLSRADFNPLNLASGIGAFALLESQYVRRFALPDADLQKEISEAELIKILESLKKRALISETQTQTIILAFRLYSVMAGVFKKLVAENSKLVYRGAIREETQNEFYRLVDESYAKRYGSGKPWGTKEPLDYAVSLGLAIFGVLTDSLRDEFMERLPSVSNLREIQPLEQVAGETGTDVEAPLQLVLDTRDDLTLFLERPIGFRYANAKYIRILPLARGEPDFVEAMVYHFRYAPEDILRIILFAIENEARIDHRIQRAISLIVSEKTETPDSEWTSRFNKKGWPILKEILSSSKKVHYAEIQLARFHLVTFLFDDSDRPSSKNLIFMHRAMTILEDMKENDPFRKQLFQAFEAVKKTPLYLLLLRLVLYPNMRNKIEAVSDDRDSIRFRFSLIDEAAQILLSKELLTTEEMENSVRDILKIAKKNNMANDEKLAFFRTVYLISFVQKLSELDVVRREISLQEGTHSFFAQLEQAYLALMGTMAQGGFSSEELSAAMENFKAMVHNTKTWAEEVIGNKLYLSNLYDTSLLRQFKNEIYEAGVWQNVLNEYLKQAQVGELDGLRKHLVDISKSEEKLEEYFKLFAKGHSDYFLRNISSPEILRQLYHWIHLNYLRNFKNAKNVVAVQAVSRPLFFRKIHTPTHHAYEVGIGGIIDHPGVLPLYVKVLKKNGFYVTVFKPSLVEFPGVEEKGFIIHIWGYFLHTDKPEERIAAIGQDLQKMTQAGRSFFSSDAKSKMISATKNAWRYALTSTSDGYGIIRSEKINQVGLVEKNNIKIKGETESDTTELLIETNQKRTNFYETLTGLFYEKFPDISVISVKRITNDNWERVLIKFEKNLTKKTQRSIREQIEKYLETDVTEISVRGVTYSDIARSEERIKRSEVSSTQEYANSLNKVFERPGIKKIMKNWQVVDPGLLNPKKARLWFARELLTSLGTENGNVTNDSLKSLAKKITNNEAFLNSEEFLQSEMSEIHANLSGLNKDEWDEFLHNAPVLAATLVALRARLAVNVDMSKKEAAELEGQFISFLKGEGISLGNGQLRFVSSSARKPFASFKSGKIAALFARDESLVATYNKNVRSRWYEPTDDMTRLVSGLVTATLYSVSDGAGNPLEVKTPSMFETMFEAVATAIQGYSVIGKAA